MNSQNDLELHRQSVHSAVVDVLLRYNKEKRSMRSILRNYQSVNLKGATLLSEVHFLSLNIIRYLNSIDFLMSRAMGRRKSRELSARTLTELRIAIFQKHWLHETETGILASLSIDDPRQILILKRAFRLDLDDILRTLPRIQEYSLRYAHPTFLVETLLSKLSDSDSIALLESNNQSSPTYIRPNMLLGSPNRLLETLDSLGIEISADPDIEHLYRVESNLDILISSNIFQRNEVLIQDKASICTVRALGPKPGDIVWDACAAPGMKTQLIWELMSRKGKIIATEFDQNRLVHAKKRAISLGIDEVNWLRSDAATCPIKGANKILIDAPCTSTGMLRSHPSYKWKLNKKSLFSIMAIQNKILEGIISQYEGRTGTEITYSTCSILPHEGESQIDTILSKYKIELLSIPEISQRGYPGFHCSDNVRRLFPHIHNTDGFFIAKMRITP